MADDKKTNREKASLSETLKVYLGSHRKLIFGITLGLIVLVFGSVVAYQIHHNRQEQATRQAEEITEAWISWQQERDDQAEREIREAIEAVRSSYPRSYGALRALHVLMLMEWELEQFSEARKTGLMLADGFPRSHLAGAALASAAAAAEEEGDLEEAKAILLRIARGEGAPSAETARALFNLGRLSEELKTYDDALDFYNQLAGEHPESNWTKLAKNRIIWLTSQGGSSNT
ncbi:hypothetical protein SAMN05920897_102155 [Alkalispirochaeta americana]|uniref:Uncharacterized protein n=1 Tax=Alkalispirochaeta americana TaxID=159291 RepID=A0A1N6P6H4_9SPIO|nr:tetratricopeptide repeat protein [Alkalispirochaeta americana]SIP99991.1 hypothetical protein SAMN05920897_102155 [Alkalispirochaeta americana]